MADDPEIDLNFNDHASPRIRNLGDNLNDLGREAVRTRGRVQDLAGETGTLSRRLIAARQQAEFMARRLDRAVTPATLRDFELATRQVRALERAMRSVDRLDPEVDVNVNVDQNRFQRTFGRLIEAGQRAGYLAADATVTSFRTAIDALPSEAKTALAGAAVGAAALAVPLIVGIIDSAILTAAGLGGLTAGIVLAARDPAVVAAYSDLGGTIKRELLDAAKPFAPELIKAADVLEQSFERIAPRIRRIFAVLAPELVPFVKELAAGVEDFMAGFEDGARASVPLIRILGRELHVILRLIGDLFSSAAAGGPAAELAFRLVLGTVETLLWSINLLLRSVGSLGSVVARVGDAIGLWDLEGVHGSLRSLTGGTDEFADAASSGITPLNAFADGLGNTATAADALNDAFARLFGEAMNLDQANLAVKAGMLELREAIKSNGKSLDDSTAKGNANAQAILGQIQALEAKRQAEIAAGNGTKSATDQANAAYAANVAALRGVLLQLGLNAAAVDTLIGKYAAIPETITTTVTTVYRTKGTPPGYSDQLTGHSRTGSADYGWSSGWAPFAFAQGFAAADAGDRAASRVGGPREITLNNRVTVDLDGQPFRDYTDRTVAAADQRRQWRDRVGVRD